MYNFKEVEKKWQKYWEENKSFKTLDDFSKKKYYSLVEFPYPSGVGMHIGHVEAYMGLEVLSRKRRMEGYNVLFPIGFDAFGLPTENYAIKNKIHPRVVTNTNVSNFLYQLKKVGFSFDWDRVVDTTDEDYYKWTQWIFLKLFENGLAFRDKTYVNYCPSCKVVLSNEDSQGGKCDICHNDVIQKEKEVWYLRITEYAEKLLEGLDEVDFLPNIRLQQENWIGKSTGAFVEFSLNVDEKLKIYTTRPDTLFGVTFMVIAPEHPLIDKYKSNIINFKDIEDYREKTSKKTEFERTQLVKDKTGVRIEGITAINPVNGKNVPIYISDYVMMNYGTGAIMAVPAHDERDYAFAKAFNIDIIPVIEKITGEKRDNEIKKNSIVALIYNPNTDEYLTLNWHEKGGRLLIGGSIKDNETDIECALREIKEETGYIDLKYLRTSFPINHHYYAYNKDKAYEINAVGIYFELLSDKQEELGLDEDESFDIEWVSKDIIEREVKDELHKTVYEWYINEDAYAGDGKYINSDFLNGMYSKDMAIDKMIEYLKGKGIGEKGVQYKIKDWAFNRQRYWGEPIPIIYCDKCGMVPVPYDELPLKLPDMENFEPGKDGESPLASIPSFVNCKCPKCGGDAKRETDTMPQWAGSSWYFLRYIDPNNDSVLADFSKLKYWLPVDWYNGGMEHVTRHLIYSRFWHRFLYDIGEVPTKEPYAKRTAQGMVLGPDGEKMSKSRGNVIDPMDIVESYGADTLRMYILFMGDYSLDKPWNDNAIKGISRFLDRVYSLQDKVIDSNDYSHKFESLINKTIKKVSEDIENVKYNTAISELMKLINEYVKEENITNLDYEVLLKLLYPFAPHITEELNSTVLNIESLVYSSWPTYDSSRIQDDTYELIVQVNGKIRGKMEVDTDISEDQMKEMALKNENVIKYIEGKEILKVITIPKKLVNIVVKG